MKDVNGILGDGDRYHVLRYENEASFGEEIAWRETGDNYEEAAKVFTSLNVFCNLPEILLQNMQRNS